MNRRGFCAAAAALIVAPRVSVAATVADAVRAVDFADYIAIGERHDNPGHHRIQAELVAALSPKGMAFEMIPQSLEATANEVRASGGSRAELGEALKWAESNWPDWSLYAPILEAAPEAYVAGGGISKSALGAVYSKGAVGVGDDLAERYGLTEQLPADMRVEMIEIQYAAHCELVGREKLGAMVEVQRAWDAAYAEAWWRAGQEGGGRSILICGNEHARFDRGAPAYLARAFPDAKIASIGLMEGDEPDSDTAFTITLSAFAPEREDPCERMRAALQKRG